MSKRIVITCEDGKLEDIKKLVLPVFTKNKIVELGGRVEIQAIDDAGVLWMQENTDDKR